MNYAKFERAQPREWRGIPWECSDADSLPSLPEALVWIFLGSMFLFLCLMLMVL